MTKEEYLFYEWMIIGKGITEIEFEKIDEEEYKKLIAEYNEFVKNT